MSGLPPLPASCSTASSAQGPATRERSWIGRRRIEIDSIVENGNHFPQPFWALRAVVDSERSQPMGVRGGSALAVRRGLMLEGSTARARADLVSTPRQILVELS